MVRGCVLVLAVLAALAVGEASAMAVPAGLKSQLRHVELLHSSKVRRRSVDAYETMEISLDFYNRTFDLQLKRREGLFRFLVKAVVIGEDGIERPFRVDEENYWMGKVAGDPESAVTLYISPLGSMLGRIHTKGVTYVLEHSHRHFGNNSGVNADEYTVVYRADELINKYDPHSSHNASGHSFCGVADEDLSQHHTEEVHVHHPHDEEHVHVHQGRHRRAQVSNINNYCLVAVIADSQFYANNGNTMPTITSLMVTHITSSDNVFSGTNWYTTNNGPTVYANLHLSVNRIIIYKTSGTDPYYSSSGYTGSTGPQTFLSLFSSAPQQSSTGGWSSSCVAHLFTHYSFSGGVLGLAWVGNPAQNSAGGVCHSSPTQWLNTGWTTSLNNGVAVPTIMDQLVTAHEIGHNWGSPHDVSGADCVGDVTNGRFLMYPTAVDGSQTNNKFFSPCSIRNITLVLQSKGSCFTTNPTGFCGDYLVNNNEQCDAGIGGDACCSTTCTFIGNATCSDTSSVCCKNCRASSNTTSCFSAFLNDPSCQGSANCNGVGFNCPNPSPKKFGEPCGSGGFCSGATASSSSCLSLCSRFGATNCKCASPDECHVCCKHNPSANNTCGSPFASAFSNGQYQCITALSVLDSVANKSCVVQPYWTSTLGTTIYYNSTQKDPACANASSCWKLLDYVPNTACSIGVCDTSGTCVAQTTSTAASPWDLSSITLSNIQKWMKQNIVGTVLIFSFVLWLPIGCLIHRYDLKQRAKNAGYGVRQSATMTFRPKANGPGMNMPRRR